ncbi:IclR family transcriptional regulator [Rhodococcus sp. ACPA4]|jgi:DNA-binding IclR family transcriptional regulator|uniref:IclR family transcriptional regulator n=2 Tax=Nocardiaceae TaxID=85025 RepID=A0A652YPI4_NOCGL|nr:MULTISPECIES: IclR family transcriptional regulator [Rhodococcus]NMD62739.1 IclR family transcriptional regulator [Nocardia globerula]MCE4266020.1 IclR family transcriptional regulator [Rhodococcus globerulus]MDV6267877.1 IclR family transcriptional regulator [Rhodococcus globerulus]MDV8065857.1 IclR family transcriptional regulator [Rhodococcus sp. IEGM 1366]NRI67858.1 IclR family transcriptional regulator [Rhodococcus sp. MS16]
MAAPQQSVGFGSVLPIAPSAAAPLQPAGELSSVLGKARMILDAFDTDHSDLSLTELTRRSGVAKATVHRLAGELVEWGLLERAGTKYRLGLRLFELGQLVPRQRILRDAALPYMEDLLLATQETVHFAVRDGIDVLYIEKIIGHRGLNQQSRVAGRLPLYCTATGKIILAFSPQSVFDEVVEQGFTALTSRTTMSVGVLRQQLERMRKEQLAVEVEETRLGYMSVAVPVFSGPRTLAGALSVTAPTARLNVSRITGALRTAGVGITRKLHAMKCTHSPSDPLALRTICSPVMCSFNGCGK